MVQTTLHGDRVPIVLDMDDYRQGHFSGASDSPMVETEHHKIELWTVLPEQTIPVHVHGGSECILIVISGLGRFELDNRAFDLKKGMVAITPPGTDHSVHNPGPDPLTVVSILGPVSSKR